MTTPRALVPRAALAGDSLRLTGEPFHHLRRVLRLARGDRVVLCDGEGGEADATIVGVEPRALRLAVAARRLVAAPVAAPVTLICAELRSERMDWLVEKATELGVDRLVPVTTERCTVRLSVATAQRRHARHQRLVEAAARQSRRSILPEVLPTRPLADALAAHADGLRLLLWEEAPRDQGLRAALGLADPATPVTLAVGPEGGFAPGEAEAARAAGFAVVSLGKTVLRAETAALVALTLALAHGGRLG